MQNEPLNNSDEKQVKRRLAKIEKRRKQFNEWFHELYGRAPVRKEHWIIQQHAAWEGWKASLDRFEARKRLGQRKGSSDA